MDIVAIGTTRFVPGFALAGLKTELADRQDVLEKVRSHDDAIVVLDGSLTEDLTPEDLRALQTSLEPVVVTLSEDSTEETEKLKRMIRTTLGVDLL